MREDARIYIIAHRKPEYGLWDNGLYTPIQVGFNERFAGLRDNDEQDNISIWNRLYAECTGTYYVWKHHPRCLRYVGQCQYRRRLEFEEDFNFDEVFRNFDVITCMPIALFPSVGRQYMNYHSPKDISLLRTVLKEECPEYVEDFDRFIMDGRFLFYANGVVMRTEDFDRYCEWLFNILERFKNKKGWDTPEIADERIDKEIECGDRVGTDGHVGTDKKADNGYQHQVLGFLSERLLTLFIRHNFEPNKIYCKEYRKYEGI